VERSWGICYYIPTYTKIMVLFIYIYICINNCTYIYEMYSHSC
jgi:hypothetical protein